MTSRLARLPLAGLILAGALAAAPAGAQQTGGSVFATQTFGLTFEGGSVREYVAAMREAAEDVPVNVIVVGDDDLLTLPEIVLEQVSVRNAVNALNYITSDTGRVMVNSTGDGPIEVFTIQVMDGRPRRATVTGASRQQEAMPSFEVFSLAELLESPADEHGGPTADTSTVLTAIDTALAMAGADDTADLKFHPDSGLLIVRGDERETKLVGQLIREVYSDVARRRQELRNLRDQLSGARTEQHKSNVRVRALQGEIEIARSEFEQMEQLQERGMVGESELRNAELTLKRMLGELEVAELEHLQRLDRVHALEQQIDALQARTQTPSSPEAIRAEIERLEERISHLREKLGDLGDEADGRRGRR